MLRRKPPTVNPPESVFERSRALGVLRVAERLLTIADLSLLTEIGGNMEELKALGELIRILEKTLPKLRPESVRWLLSRLEELSLPVEPTVSGKSRGPKVSSGVSGDDDD